MLGNVLKCYTSHYASFSGRMARKDFWLFVLFFVAALFVIHNVEMMMGMKPIIHMTVQGSAHAGNAAAASGVEHTGLGMFGSLFLIASFLPVLSAHARRLHDTNRSAWWLLIQLIPFFGGIVVLILCALKGTEGPNNYGV